MSEYSNSITIAKVKDGTSGVGLSSMTVSYAVTANPSPTPETGWSDIAPTNPTQGSWVWVRTSYSYTDPTYDKTTYTKSYVGTDGVSVRKIENYYLASASSSGVTPSTPSSGWVTNIPNIDSNLPYLWNFERTFSDEQGTSQLNETDPVIIARYTEDGAGISSTEISYIATNSSSTTPPTGTWNSQPPAVSQGQWLWTRTHYVYTTGSSYDSYSKSYVGTNGTSVTITGTSHVNGVTTVTFSGGTSISIYDGQKGESVASVVNHYLVSSESSGITRESAGWSTDVQQMTASSSYLWNYEESFTSTGITITTTNPVVIGKYAVDGSAGSQGVGISRIDEYYAISDSSTSAPTGTWSQSPIVTTTTSKYLWNYEDIIYTDGSTHQETAKRVISVHGETGSPGADGNGILSTAVNYATSNQGTTAPTSGWVTQIPTVSQGSWLWIKTVYTYSSGDPVTVYNKSYAGSNGKSISNISEYYAVSNNSTQPPAATSSQPQSPWNTTPAITTTTSPYLWNFEVITYSSGSPYVSSARVIGTHGATGPKGDDGDPGAQGVGVSSITELYYCSNSSTVPTAPNQPVTTSNPSVYEAWNKVCPIWTSTSRYYYTCSEILYTNGEHGWSNVVSNNGLSGANSVAANAQTSAGQAATAASNAQTAAQSAQSAANAAATSASNAQTAATNAQTAAQNAATSASNAQTAAQNAATSASQAATSASQAVTSANQAITAASEAKTSAQTAYNTATSAASAASSAISTANNAYALASLAKTTADGKITTYYTNVTPVTGVTGDLWIDTGNNNSLKRYTGGSPSWVAVDNSNIQNALTAASNAQATADGKINTYVSTVAPTSLTSKDVGDLWIDSGDNNRIHRWDGTSWIDEDSVVNINFIVNSDHFNPSITPYKNSVVTSTTYSLNDEIYYNSSGTRYVRIDLPSNMISGNQYTLSFDAASYTGNYGIFFTLGNGTAENIGSAPSKAWKRLEKTFTATDATYIKIQTRASSNTSTYKAAYRSFKLEEGKTATKYSLAVLQDADVEYCLADSHEELSGSEVWSTNPPIWVDGKYIWSRTKWTYFGGYILYNDPACITGNTGAKGEDGAPGDAVKYEVKLSTSKILKFIGNSVEDYGSILFNTSNVYFSLTKITNGSPTLLDVDNYKTNIAFYGTTTLIDDLWGLLYRLKGKTDPDSAEQNLLTIGKTTDSTVDIETTTFNFKNLLPYYVEGISENDSEDITAFNNFKNDLNNSQGFFQIRFYSNDADTYPSGYNKLIADTLVTYDYGTTEDMAQFRITATDIQQAVGEKKLIFDSNGLTVQYGGIFVKGANDEKLLSYDQVSNSLYIKGNGIFTGTIYANDGEFTGTVHATNGDFTGTITAQQGSIGGFTIGATQLQGSDLILDASTGTISGGTIHLTTSALIDDYIELGNARIYNPDVNNNLFITAGSNSEIVIKDTGIATFGGITINGSNSSISGTNFSITPDISVFNNIVATGKIVTSVFESNKVQTVGGTMLFKPSYKIASVSGAVLTLDTDIDITTNITAQDKVILIKADGNRLTELYTVSSVSNSNKTVTLSTTPSSTDNLNSLIILGTENSFIIGVNSTDNESIFLYPRGITISQFSGSTTINKPKVYLGDLTTLGMGFSGYGLYGDNVYLNGSLITINHEAGQQNYAGVNTLDGVSATIFDDTDNSNIIFWAGSVSEQPNDIRQAKFQVTSKGSIYASQGKFTGSVISDTIISDSALYGTDIYGARLLGWRGGSTGTDAALEIWNTRLGILFERDVYTQATISSFEAGVTYYIYSDGEYVRVASDATYNSSTTYYTRSGEATLSINQNGLAFPHLSENQNIILIDENDSNHVKFNGYSFSTDNLLVKGRTLQSNNNGLQNYLISINESESNQILLQTGNIQSTFSPFEVNLSQTQFNCGGDVTYGGTMVYKRVYTGQSIIGYDLYVS